MGKGPSKISFSRGELLALSSPEFMKNNHRLMKLSKIESELSKQKAQLPNWKNVIGLHFENIVFI